ncbi:glycoside hydrolase family 3 C-terminal domain-containing protein [Amnibacterium sp. CER49]|uniref:glycoside hydrolase family 3 protein n=1 Tax=Amnibacterium sp. CER49 TaxID=3039161 RepID=UPI00244C44B8|nr:glycoside hydrolase family 3 C-terminal domain-containing protein [Amnibacterium sp. CER49]MDH2443147.1 glycoside hydrolase family 3 C-terminal domain-containing protein [Amnibacterium sp. CER49]
MHGPIDWDVALHRAEVRLAALPEADRDAIALAAFDRVGEPGFVPFVYVDGPNGAREVPGATAFPSALALAATFDRDLAGDYGRVLAAEVLAAGRNALLGPALDLARVPQSGRAGENLGEDPVLAGEIGGQIVESLQAAGVLAVVKHYVANGFEWLRTGSGFPQRGPAMDVRVDPRTLADLYLEPFRRVVRHGAAALMGSYNRLNGEYVCQSPDLLALPRERWGWRGVTIPDFLFAVRDPAAALAAGLDLPGLDGAAGRTPEHLGADRARRDAAVLHVLTAAEAIGLRAPREDPGALGGAEALALAERIETEGMVLLRNEGDLLPLADGTRVALIAPETAGALLVIGGSAAVVPPSDRVPGLEETLAARLTVTSAPGVPGVAPLPPLPADRTEHGIRVTLRTADGAERELAPTSAEVEAPDGPPAAWSALLETRIVPTRSGRHVLALELAGEAVLLVDGHPVASGFREASPFVVGPLLPLFATVDLEAGRAADVRVEYTSGVAISIPIPHSPIRPHLRLGWSEPDDRVANAARLAADADVAVVLAGRVSGEGMDTDGLRLPGSQEDLLAAVVAANPRTVLVTLGAGPVVLPDGAPPAALLHAWFPGERFAPALTAVVTGDAEPGGRLVTTWPAAEDRTPIETPVQYPGADGSVEHTEGLLVGYRWYDARGEDPAFPFGHGLGYTTFDLTDARAAVGADDVVVAVTVRNVGDRRGKAVPQVYVAFPPEADQPPRQLQAFAAVRLEPGEERRVELRVPLDDLARADGSGRRRLVPGEHVAFIGVSSRDVRLEAPFAVPAAGAGGE